MKIIKIFEIISFITAIVLLIIWIASVGYTIIDLSSLERNVNAIDILIMPGGIILILLFLLLGCKLNDYNKTVNKI